MGLWLTQWLILLIRQLKKSQQILGTQFTKTLQYTSAQHKHTPQTHNGF